MITFARFNDATLRMERLPMPDAIAQRICDTFLESKKWHDDLPLLHRMHRGVIAELRTVPDPEPEAEPEAWVQDAIAMREQDPPVPWRDIGRRLDKPQTTVRRAVAAALVAAP